ncbi:MAG: hypothetical protein QXI89_02505 [Candidatus Anstonellales archaeon]
MVDIKILNENENTIEFLLKSSVRFANALRRYAMSRVPVLAIDKVTFYENRTALFDEYIAHRIGLIPIKDADIKAEGVGFYLDAIGPKIVYSEDLQCNNEKTGVAIKGIPIITLAEGQSLRLEGFLKRGIGREHMKFQASITAYKESSDGFQFFIESIGQMSARNVLIKALKEMHNDLEQLEQSLEKF